MAETENLKERIDHVLDECHEIIKVFDAGLSDFSKISFRQVKEIDEAILRLKKQGFHVPDELKQVKIKLLSDFEKKKELSSLLEYFAVAIQKLLSQNIIKSQGRSQIRSGRDRAKKDRKPSNYERPLGSKGNTNLEDYLIPVINLMNKGYTYREAFHSVKDKLDVRYNTVSAQCTRVLGLRTEEFVSQVESGKIVALLQKKFPDKYLVIKNSIAKRR